MWTDTRKDQELRKIGTVMVPLYVHWGIYVTLVLPFYVHAIMSRYRQSKLWYTSSSLNVPLQLVGPPAAQRAMRWGAERMLRVFHCCSI